MCNKNQNQGINYSILEEDIPNNTTGRVNHADVPVSNPFQEEGQNKIFNNHSEYSLKGIINHDDSSDYFFSKHNINVIQQTIRYEVYKKLNKIIDNQSEQELFVIMRSIYLQYGGKEINNKLEFQNNILNLNNRVISYSVNNISNQLQQLDMYIKDISSLPIPLEHPSYENKNNFTYNYSPMI